MVIITVGELLDRCLAFETRRMAYYAAIRDRSADNGVRLLTYFLARQGRRLQHVLDDLAPSLLQQLRKVELKFDVPLPGVSGLRLPDLLPETNPGDALLNAALTYDGEMVSFYKALRAQSFNEEVTEVLEALIQGEEGDRVMLKKILDMHYF